MTAGMRSLAASLSVMRPSARYMAGTPSFSRHSFNHFPAGVT